jgi:uncharacterized protein (TIGR00730 family)
LSPAPPNGNGGCRLLEGTDALVTLPGGTGTLEELLEALTLKRLGLFLRPIVLVDQQGFYDGLLALLDRCITEAFMDVRHREMWRVVSSADEALDAIATAASRSADGREFAVKKSGR